MVFTQVNSDLNYLTVANMLSQTVVFITNGNRTSENYPTFMTLSKLIKTTVVNLVVNKYTVW